MEDMMLTEAGHRTRRAAIGAAAGAARRARVAKLHVVAVATTLTVAGLVPGEIAAQEGERAQRCICVDSLSPRVWQGTWGPSVVYSFRGFGSRAQIGVVLDTDEEGLDGVRVRQVTRGWPAEQAGLQAGDVITAVNGKRLTEPVEGEESIRGYGRYGARLVAALQTVEPGDTVQIEYRRDGRMHTVSVVTRNAFDFAFPALDSTVMRRALEGVEMLRAAPIAGVRAFTASRWARANGVELTDLDPELGEYFEAEGGVLVVRVDESSTLGLRPGDVILRIDGRQVEDAQHAVRILQSYRADERMEIEVIRRGARTTVEGRRAGRRR